MQQFLVKSYAIARRMGVWSSWLGRDLFPRLYFLYKRLMEENQAHLIHRLARPGTLAIDVGANIGYFTLIMARAVGSEGAVLTFEPDEDNLRSLRQEVQRAGALNVRVVPAAVGERSGTITLYRNEDHPGDHRIYPADAHAKSHEVRLWSLNDFLEGEGSSRDLSLVKIDVQGAELNVLRGLRRTLKRYPQARVLIEFDPELLRQGGQAPKT